MWNGAIGMAKERGERVENDDEIDNNEERKKLVEISRYPRPNLLLKFLTSGSDSSSF